MVFKAICISRSSHADGEAVGRAVAERLGLRYVDDEVIAEAAEWADLDPALVADVERRKSFAARLLGNVTEHGTAVRLQTEAPTRALPTDADLRMLIADVLRSFADEGSVVIVAHAASFALTGGDFLRVLVTASDQTRIERVAAGTGTDERDAAKIIREDDASRADYLKRFYGVGRELPTHFDLVINTDTLTAAQAAEIVVSAASSPHA